jgi:hypothetical protein
MAEVFLARYLGPEGFEKRLVIKRVLPQLSDDRRLLRMFFEEARTQVSLSHGNLVSVFDFGRVANDYFIAMEHVDGVDLATVVARARAAGTVLPPAVVAYIGGELCRALAYVHRRGFVHRDLTPRNVLISRDGEVKLSDFGVALALASEAEPGLRGTLAYMAPEQARGERVDGRADLCALGYVLAEAATGRRARQAEGQAEGEEALLAAARAGAPAIIDGPLAAIVARATATAPEDRFESADAMLTALEAVAAQTGSGRDPAMRALAALLPASPGEARTETSAGVAPDEQGTAGDSAEARRRGPGETYFRDSRSPTFIDDVLGSPERLRAAAPARSRAWLAAGLIAAIAAAVTAGLVSRRTSSSAGTPPQAAPPVAAPPTVAIANVDASPARPEVPPALDGSTAPTASSLATKRPQAPAQRRAQRPSTVVPRGAPAAVPVENGHLVIQCTPWCVPYIDGQARGKDGRSFPLQVPVGAHVVEVRRLSDQQQRNVRVVAGEAPQLLSFTFK